jgi:hypothetical protein
MIHDPQLPAHGLGGDDDAVFLEHPLAEVDKPPAHEAMQGGDRTVFNHAGQRPAVLGPHARRLPWHLAGDGPDGPWALNLRTKSRTI